MKAINRISKYLLDNNINNAEAERLWGLSNGYLSKQMSRNGDLGESIIKKILENSPDISLEWLIFGTNTRDEVLSGIQVLHKPKSREVLLDNQTVNLYAFEASAGLKTLFNDNANYIIDTIRIPNLPKCDGAIHIVGDSMTPVLKSGDIILYKEVSLNYQDIYFGETYLLSYYEDEFDVAVVVKYIHKSDREGWIKLVSHNKHHAPREIEFNKVNAMAIVKATIRINSMY